MESQSDNSPHSPHKLNKYNLCCLLSNPPAGLKHRTITYSSWQKDKNHSRIFEIYIHNLKVLAGLLEYSAKNGWGHRISSSLMPLLTHQSVFAIDCYEDFDFLRLIPEITRELNKCRDIIRDKKIRVSMHPGQYNVLESDNPNTVINAIKELNWHGWLLDQLGCARNHWSPINLHIHTSKGNFYSLAGRFIKGFKLLHPSVQSRLTIENNDKGGEQSLDNTPWHCENLLEFREIAEPHIGYIPLCYDNLHDKLLRSPNLSPEECFHKFYETWPVDKTTDQEIIPIFHHSESDGGVSHNDYPSFIPDGYGKMVHWDVELKKKELAIKKLEGIQ